MIQYWLFLYEMNGVSQLLYIEVIDILKLACLLFTYVCMLAGRFCVLLFFLALVLNLSLLSCTGFDVFHHIWRVLSNLLSQYIPKSFKTNGKQYSLCRIIRSCEKRKKKHYIYSTEVSIFWEKRI